MPDGASRFYSGAAFHPSLPDGREEGSIRIGGGVVRFDSPSGSVELPIRGTALEIGGASDRLVFLSNPAFPGWSLYTSDQSVLRDPDLLADRDVAARLSTLRRGPAAARLLTAAVLLLVGAILAGVFVLRGTIVAAIAVRIPPSVEQRLGELAFRQITLTGNEITDPRVVAPLQRIVDRISRSIPDGSGNFRVHVVVDHEVNAYAFPGGPMVINTGLIERAGSGNEIAGVLAHEMAHVALHHSTRQMIESLGLWTVIRALFGDLTGLGAVLIDNSGRLVDMKFSRDFEREADRTGLRYLVRAGLDPRGMLSFFERLRRDESSLLGSGALALLRTHPATPERIADLQSEIDRLPQIPSGRVDIDLLRVQEWIAPQNDNRGKLR